ncbi:MAG: UDP-N-acetylmuramoyl-tripeptide--D-alanyl-D-alanine ligase [candidate division WOR-3 bacterium]
MYKEFTLAEIAKIIKGKEEIDNLELVRRVCVDSRQVKPGDLFFALKGEKTDGHLFVNEALKRGAVGVVVQKSQNLKQQILVSDTLYALGELARNYRQRIPVRVIGITGTNGKTTVKNLIGAVIREKFSVHCSERNYNSLIGLPLSILKMSGTEEFAVLEMGTSSPGEIKRLCEIARPAIGIITAVGPGHIEKLGSIAGIKQEKLSLFDSLPQGSFAMIGEGLNLNDIKNDKIEILQVSYRDIEEVKLKEDGSYFTYKKENFFTPLLGMGNVYNCLFAISLATKIGIDINSQKRAISMIRPESGRMEPIRKDGILIINDSYNANPLSMKSAIDFVAQLPRRRILVLGDMRELGSNSESYHKEIGEYARPRCDLLLSLGEESILYQGRHFKEGVRLIRFLLESLQGREVVLFKASRALEFEKLVNLFLKFL